MDEGDREPVPNTDDAIVACGGCGKPLLRGQPVFHFDDQRFHVDCVPAEHASRAQALLGVKSC